jgi:hypothetical protein
VSSDLAFPLSPLGCEVEDAGAYVATCDGGGCDAETAALVLTSDERWVSMCEWHAIEELKLTARARRAIQ